MLNDASLEVGLKEFKGKLSAYLWPRCPLLPPGTSVGGIARGGIDKTLPRISV